MRNDACESGAKGPLDYKLKMLKVGVGYLKIFLFFPAFPI